MVRTAAAMCLAQCIMHHHQDTSIHSHWGGPIGSCSSQRLRWRAGLGCVVLVVAGPRGAQRSSCVLAADNRSRTQLVAETAVGT